LGWLMAPTRAAGKTRIGCAGWSLPARYRASFPSTGTVLERYAAVLNAVEINSSFYRPHQRATYVRWAESVPHDFRFSVKVPKVITHDRHLKGIAAELKTFLQQVAGLGAKTGGLLVQLPPSLPFNGRVAKAFFERMRGEVSPRISIACEPRHPSWLEPKATELWSQYNINRVGADPPPVPDADHPGTAGRWRYRRMHGSPRMYYDNYDAAALCLLRDGAAAASPRVTTWVIFDNTAAEHAVGNALELTSLLAGKLRA
jgi:uncharacterized protein YecE (DUF72 family)